MDLTLPYGYVTALLGANGSGKTTLIKILLGLIAPAGGGVTILGADPRTLPAGVRAVLDTSYFVPDWRVGEALRALRPTADAWDDALVRQLVERFDLPREGRIKELSRGEASKLKLTVALAARPQLLILDEPTSGLDPLAREQVLQVIREFMVDPTHSVLFSTHIPSDMPGLADQVVALRQGQVVLDRPMDQLTDDFFAVRGVREELDHLPDVLIGVRRTATNFTAIVAADQTAGLPPSVLVEAADVDDVAKALAVPVEGIDL
ncbi:ABC transporter ATP-binding protein [Propioniciclava coleopterorum]|uniref:ABC transporter ATP-binding protein n=1 Tax=Propioniciclava coleopterorum TaxID=2714937 RepID=A0A6G7Y657_9ACTN|nr:ABC transporter ATP-binding protein [Propioniciclava coleopterorum]QIK72199.1 ABC transporter ATP-binding protein [Propioniciclava coleopterorum]